jgi:hypothetical protein
VTQLEKDIERKLRVTVTKLGGQCLKWNCPGWSGVPDRIILLPGGRVLFAETKRPKGGKLSAMQKWWLSKLKRLGFWAGVVWNDAHINRLALFILEKETET